MAKTITTEELLKLPDIVTTEDLVGKNPPNKNIVTTEELFGKDSVVSDIKKHPILNLLSPRYGGLGIKSPEDISDIASKLNPLTLATKPLEFLPQTKEPAKKFSKELLYSSIPTPADIITLGAGKAIRKGAEVVPKLRSLMKKIPKEMPIKQVPKVETPPVIIPKKGIKLPEDLQPFADRARQLSKEEFVTKYNAGLKAQNLTTRDTAKNIDKLIKQSGFKNAENFYDKITGKIKPIEEVKTPDFAENINLTKYPEDVRKSIYDLVSKKPEIGKTPTISDIELLSKAKELKDTPTIKMLANLPEGTVEAEALKLRQGNVETIRTALKGELEGLKTNLDNVLEKGIELHRKTASMFGRGLRQQRLPAEIQQEMAFTIDSTIKRITKDPIFSKDQELINTLKKLRQITVDKEFNPTIWNKVYYAWMNSILSNPFTHIVNTASNTLFTLQKIPEKFAGAVWDLPISTFTGKRTQFFGEVPAMVKGAFSKGKLPQELAQGSKVEYFSRPIQGKAGKVIGTPTTLLQLEDNFAKNIIGKMELAGQKYAGKTGEALTKAVSEEQLYRTFQNDAGVVADTLIMIRNRIPMLRYVIPFIKTPANLITRGLERTPLGVIKVARGILHKTYTQETLAKDLGNLTLGTIGAGWIGLQWAKGNITGRVPYDSDERDAFYRQGKKPNSIRIGNKWIPLERFEPLGTSFSVMANLFQDYKNSDKETIPEKSLDAITKFGSTLINKTYLSGFTQMINALSNPEQYGQNFLRRIVTGVEPQLLKFFADLKDPYYREANTILEQLKAKTPFLSETLPPKLNVFGEPVKRDFLNIGKVNPDEIEKMIEETPIGFPSKSLGKEKLTPKEYRWLLMTSGGKLKEDLIKISPEKFNQLPLEIKEKIINRLQERARTVPRGILRIKRALNKE